VSCLPVGVDDDQYSERTLPGPPSRGHDSKSRGSAKKQRFSTYTTVARPGDALPRVAGDKDNARCVAPARFACRPARWGDGDVVSH